MKRGALVLVGLLTVFGFGFGACKVEPIETLELDEPSRVELPSTVLPFGTARAAHTQGPAEWEPAVEAAALTPFVAALSRGAEQTSGWLWDRINHLALPRWLGGGETLPPPAALTPTPAPAPTPALPPTPPPAP